MMDDNEYSDVTPDEEFEDFVVAVVARSMEEAEAYCELLADRDIPTIIGERGAIDASRGDSTINGVSVLVPEMLLDEAGIIISGREEADELDAPPEEIDDAQLLAEINNDLDDDDYLFDDDS
ncbi:MAG: hypothetical protein J7M14_01115 [Planctomycetes bacterium]|nr:hypothetical protein [Planctomycetota bacterium]